MPKKIWQIFSFWKEVSSINSLSQSVVTVKHLCYIRLVYCKIVLHSLQVYYGIEVMCDDDRHTTIMLLFVIRHTPIITYGVIRLSMYSR